MSEIVQGGESEVAILLARIDAEMRAARRALSDPAITAPHEFITKRMERMSIMHDQLQQLVPGEQALALVVQAMESATDQGEAPCSQ